MRETEVNPVRINNGADAVHYVVYAGALPKLSPFDMPEQQCPFRLVFAPKLSLLNVYPRQSAGADLLAEKKR